MAEGVKEMLRAAALGLTIVKSYQGLPFNGSDEIFFCTELNSVCKWDPEVEDWKAMSLERFAPHLETDIRNDRKAAIRDQKARKNA